MSAEDPIKARLRNAAYARMGQRQFGRTPAFEGEFDRLLDAAASTMRAEGAANDEPHMRAAEAVAVVFADAVMESAQARGFSEAHEPTFFDAVNRLCPIWPFC